MEKKLVQWHRRRGYSRALFFSLNSIVRFSNEAKQISLFCKQHHYPPPILKLKRNSNGEFCIHHIDETCEYFCDFSFAMFSCLQSIAYKVTTTMPCQLKLLNEIQPQHDHTRVAIYFNHDEFAPIVCFRPPHYFATFSLKQFQMWLEEGVPCETFIVFAVLGGFLHPSLPYAPFIECLAQRNVVDVLRVKPNWISVIGHAGDYGLELMVGVHLGYSLKYASPEIRAYSILLLYDYFAKE